MTSLSVALQASLLGREPEAVLTRFDCRKFRGQRLLVTGAGGSIGSELAEQLAACQPQTLTLFDHAEYNLFQVERSIRERHPEVPINAVLGDVSRRADIHAACLLARPTAIYHAAAYKHVPIAERSVVAACRVNVLGTWEAARAARELGARFVLVSSDKAAEPRSVMGATKRFAELLVLSQRSRLFRPIAVRFGNILGSSGSVLEIMMRALENGRPVPITDPAASRFFMTAPEAASLIMKADLIGRGGEVFWLEMGSSLAIATLAERLFAALAPDQPPSIEIIGLRPGEKLREELTTQGLAMRPTSHARILSARQPQVDKRQALTALGKMRLACARGDASGALAALADGAGDYEPSDAAAAAARDTSTAMLRARAATVRLPRAS